MTNTKTTAVVAMAIACAFVATNPSKEDYAAWATQRIKMGNGDSILAGLFFAATGNTLLSNSTARKNFV